MEKQITLKNKLSQLQKLSQELEVLGNEWGIKPEILFNLSLVLEEVFVIYYTDMPEQTSDISIDFVFTDMETELKIEIITSGKKFNVLCLSPKTNSRRTKISNDRETGSLGLPFILQNVNTVSYQRKKDINTLTLIKHY